MAHKERPAISDGPINQRPIEQRTGLTGATARVDVYFSDSLKALCHSLMERCVDSACERFHGITSPAHRHR
jgi:DICT domain-containing protein